MSNLTHDTMSEDMNNGCINTHLLFEPECEEVIQNSPSEWRETIKSYFKTMSDMQKKTFLIAKNHLGTSFNIFKSNGFVNFEKQLQANKETNK
jgi:hypothetical protein